MKLSAAQLLLIGGALSSIGAALPHQDLPQQRLAKSLEPITDKFAKQDPYTPGYRDPYDRAIDPIQEDLDPLPWRNGHGASILGPYNRHRSRQSPDLIRPPSTDHGQIPNMRWSFTDSHVRIEVTLSSNLILSKHPRRHTSIVWSNKHMCMDYY